MAEKNRIFTTKAEFDRWWDAVLGDGFYIEESDIPDEMWEAVWADGSPPDMAFSFTMMTLGWEGNGDPKPSAWMSAEDIARWRLDVPSMFRRWRAANDPTLTTFVVRVPAEHVAALREWAKTHDATVTAGDTEADRG